jgi:hypothetical protein
MDADAPLSLEDAKLRVLSLGAGVQSSTLALMAARGDIAPFDAIIFADTGWESQSVYKWIDWLDTQLAAPIVRVKRPGPDLGQSWLQVVKGDLPHSGTPLPGMFLTGKGLSQFQCSKEFKTRVVLREIRRMLGLSRGQRGPKGTAVEQALGIDYAEMFRMKESEAPFVKNIFPLVDMRMRRADCKRWMAERQYPEPPRSACIFCPFRSDAEWHDLKQSDPVDFERAARLDEAIRPGWPGMTGAAFLHRTLRPIREIDFTPPPDLFSQSAEEWGTKQDCEGACGV